MAYIKSKQIRLLNIILILLLINFSDNKSPNKLNNKSILIKEQLNKLINAAPWPDGRTDFYPDELRRRIQ